MALGADGPRPPPFRVFPDELGKRLLRGFGAGLSRDGSFLDSLTEHLHFDPVPDVAAREVGFPEESTVLGSILECPFLEVGKLTGHASWPQADSHFRRLAANPGVVKQLADRDVLQPPVSIVPRLGSRKLPLFSRHLDQRVLELLARGHSAAFAAPIWDLGDDGDDVRR